MFVISCTGGGKLAKNLARLLSASFDEISLERFPDGELHLRFPRENYNGENIVLVQSLSPSPNEKLLELLLAERGAKELGAKKITAVIPYLAYARQDSQFNPGEVVSNKIVCDLIQHAGADEFYSVASHLHRIRSFSQLFSIPAQDVLMSEEMANWITKKIGRKNVVVVGPDGESMRLVKPVADLLSCDFGTFTKKRLSGSRIKHLSAPDVDVKGKHAVIIDDIVSTGATVIDAAKILKKMGAVKVSCICVHLMQEQSGKKLLKSGLKFFACSNTISSRYSELDAAYPIAKAMRQ